MCMAVAARGFNLLCVAQTLTISPNRLKERPYPTCGQSCMSRARMAELVDAPASGAGAGNGVEVRVLFRAPFFPHHITKPDDQFFMSVSRAAAVGVVPQ